MDEYYYKDQRACGGGHVQVAVDECTYEYLCMNCGTADAIRLLLAVGTVSDERTDGLVTVGQAGAMFRKGRWWSVVSVSEGREGKKVRHCKVYYLDYCTMNGVSERELSEWMPCSHWPVQR